MISCKFPGLLNTESEYRNRPRSQLIDMYKLCVYLYDFHVRWVCQMKFWWSDALNKSDGLRLVVKVRCKIQKSDGKQF